MAEGTNISEADWASVQAEREGTTPPAPAAAAPVAAPAANTEDPKPEETPLAEGEVAAPVAQPDPDVQARLARFDELAALVPKLVDELRETRGRVSRMQSDLAKSQPTQKEVAAAVKDPDKWNELKKDFPEWGTAIAEFVEAKLGAVTGAPQGPTAEDIERLVSERTADATATVTRELNESLVAMRHPNWKSDIKTPVFHEWYTAQKPEVRALADSKSGIDAIRMLDLFTAYKAKPAAVVAQERKERLEAAVTARPNSQGAVATKTFDEMTAKEQWDYLAKERERAAV